jgi:hypothetical protein
VDTLLPLLLLAAGAGFAVQFFMRLRRAVDASEEVSRRLKLQLIRDAGLMLHAPDLKGAIGQQAVSMHSERDTTGRKRLKVLIRAHSVCPPHMLQVQPRQGWARLKALVSRESIDAHDPDLNAVAAIYGEPFFAASLLNAAARRAIIDAITAYDMEIIHGDAVIERTTPVSDPDELEAMLRAVARVGDALALRGSLPDRLLSSVVSDPIPAVRLRCLDLLLDLPTDPTQRHAAQTALQSTSPAVRLRAATFLGPDGFDTLARLALDPDAPPSMRGKSLEYLAFQAPAAVILPLIAPALASATPQVIRAAAVAASRHQHRAAFDALHKLIDHPATLADPDPDTDAAIARALGRLGDVPSQPILQKLLDSPHDPVRVAAAESLGFIGDTEAVASLLPLTQGGRASTTLKQTARAAVEAIQARARGAGAGQLALSNDGGDGGGGDVSLIDLP